MKTSIEKLSHLVTVLKGVKEKHKSFSLSTWVDNDCGTTACAVGWGAMDKTFNEMGLKLKPVSDEDDVLGYLTPHFDGETSWFAVAKFFDISFNTCDVLFYDAFYPVLRIDDIDYVIERIEAYVEGRLDVEAILQSHDYNTVFKS